MMYIHFCKTCSRFHILNGHKLSCPACNNPLYELRLPYIDYVNLSSKERELLLEQCHNEGSLKKTCIKICK